MFVVLSISVHVFHSTVSVQDPNESWTFFIRNEKVIITGKKMKNNENINRMKNNDLSNYNIIIKEKI